MNKTKEINGKTFSVAPFMAVEGLRLKVYIMKKFGSALAQLISEKGLETEISSRNLSKAVETLMNNLTEDEFISFLKRISVNTTVSWKDEDGTHTLAFANDFNTAMDAVFKEHLFDIYPFIGFVLEVNYPDFFTKVLPNFGVLMSQTNG